MPHWSPMLHGKTVTNAATKRNLDVGQTAWLHLQLLQPEMFTASGGTLCTPAQPLTSAPESFLILCHPCSSSTWGWWLAKLLQNPYACSCRNFSFFLQMIWMSWVWTQTGNCSCHQQELAFALGVVRLTPQVLVSPLLFAKVNGRHLSATTAQTLVLGQQPFRKIWQKKAEWESLPR